jgi:hypothetical protein
VAEALPAGMVARLNELGAELAAWAREHRDAALAAHEQGVLAAARRALPGLLAEVVRLGTSGLDGRHGPLREPCPGCGGRRPARGWRGRSVLTVCGALAFERPWHVCRACRRGWAPADAVLGVAPRARLSAGVDAWAVELGAATDFREAAALLEHLTGLAVAPETVRRRTEDAGAALAGEAEAEAAAVQRARAPVGPVDPAPGVLLVETDGVLVRYRSGWHEVKVGLVAGCVAGEAVAPTYVARRADPAGFGPYLLAAAARRGALDVVAWQGGLWERALAVLRAVVVLGDGAVWIWNLAAEHFGDRTEVVDFYHAAQHLWELAQALHGRDSPAAAGAAAAWRRALLDEGAGALLAAWRGLPTATPAQTEALRLARHYVRTNAARMDYPAFRAAGLPIGSGPVESAGKHLVQLRLKRPGARWSEPGATALLALRARRASTLPAAA